MDNLKVFYNKVKTVSTKFGAAMIVKSTPNFRGGKSCPFVGRVIKETLIKNCRFGSYENSVNNALERKGIDNNYKASGRKGMSFVEGMYPYILQSDKDNTQYYLTMNYKSTDKTTFENVYFLDGFLVTDDAKRKEIESWIYAAPKKANEKQTEAGLEKEEQVKVVTYKLENIVHIGKVSDMQDLWNMLTM